MKIIVLTLFPEMFPGVLGMSLPGQALKRGDWELKAINIRDFATDKHKTVDDTPYGGGAGMVLRPDIVAAAIRAAKAELPDAPVLYLSPRGRTMVQGMVQQLARLPGLILLCGRYEGIDQRVLEAEGVVEVSIGDYVLAGGELPAMVMCEAIVRLLPGVLGNDATHDEESFSGGLLEYPHYTRPVEWEGRPVPAVLAGGNHAAINLWRRGQAEALTEERRPDLWAAYQTAQKAKK